MKRYLIIVKALVERKTVVRQNSYTPPAPSDHASTVSFIGEKTQLDIASCIDARTTEDGSLLKGSFR